MNIDLVLAPNPGMLTGPGTNTWIVSHERATVVIDPGPTIDRHVEAVHAALADRTPLAVLVTHTHPDHAPAANGLAADLGVPAIGPAAGPDFSPDRSIADGEREVFGSIVMECVATPGHTPDSVSYRVGDALFAGDHIMGGSTVVVEDMSEYMKSLQKLQGIGLRAIYPGHGPVIDAPETVLSEYIAHRQEREDQIVDALRRGVGSLGELVTDVYADVDPALHRAAAVSVTAHLGKLRIEGRVTVQDEPVWNSEITLS